MKIHTGDTVLIITGKDKGKQGRVIRTLASQNRVVVEGINMRTRHIKKTPNQAGQRIQYEASIHASNVMILDPKSKKPTRIGYKIDDKGNKKRIAMLSGEVITKAAAKAAPKKSPAKGAKTEAKEEKVAVTKEAPANPAKQPFWKRGGKGKGEVEGGSGGGAGPDSNVIQTAHRAQGG